MIVLSVLLLSETRRQTLVIGVIGLMIMIFTGIGVVVLLPVEQTIVPVVVDTLGLIAPVEQILDPAWVRILQALQVIIAPIPGQILGSIAGVLFGTLHGTVYSLIGVGVGSTVVFIFARRIGRPAIQRFFDLDRFSRWDERLIDGNGGVALLFGAFLLPTFPDDLLCFVAGLSNIRLRTFIILVLTGRAPTFALAAYAGSNVIDGRIILFITTVSVVILLWSFVHYYRDRFIDLIG
jgi:uncharacterized membrane protein YdjX (TVP38/TMEM64 family)